jgi:hypothetical protein
MGYRFWVVQIVQFVKAVQIVEVVEAVKIVEAFHGSSWGQITRITHNEQRITNKG